MTKKLSISLYITSLIIITFVLIITLCTFVLKDLKYYVNQSFDIIEDKTGFVITIADINLTGSGIRINNLSITEPEKELALLTSKNVLLQIKLLPLLKGKIITSGLILHEPEFSISGIKDGNWSNLIKNPFSFNYKPADNNFFSFSFNPENIAIREGRLLYRNTSQGIFTSLDEVNADITVNKNKNDYILDVSAKHFQDKSTGLLSLITRFSFKENNFSPENFSAEGDINLSSVPASGLIPDIKNHLLPEYQGLKLNGLIKFNISPGLNFNVSSQIKPYHPNKSSQNDSILEFKSRGNKDEVIFDSIKISLFDALNAAGNAVLQNIQSESPGIDISLVSADADINYLKQIFNINSLPVPIPNIINKFQSGKIFIKDTRIQVPDIAEKPDTAFSIEGNCKLITSTINISSQFPLLNISSSNFIFNNEVLTGTAAIHIFENDNSTLKINIIDPFKEPEVKLLIDSRFSAETIDGVLYKFADSKPTLNISEYASGIITAKTILNYNNKIKISSMIDLTSTEYKISNKITKPKNLHNIISLSTQLNNKINKIAFTYSISKSLVLSGTINTLKPLTLNGEYKLHKFNINSFNFPLFPETLALSGKISGTGDFNIHSNNKALLPFTGLIKLEQLNIKDKTKSTDLISADLTGKISKKNLQIQNSRIIVGKTDIRAKGNLSSALPPKGSLTFNVDFFDIDEFIRKINTIVKHAKNNKLPKKPSSSNLFLKTDLDIDLQVKNGNFLKWDFDNTTSNFTYIGSTLTWENIYLYCDNGTAQGKVIYDYTNPGRYKLEFHPLKTSLDFTTLIPMFKKNKKITGETNLSGSFLSTYKKGSEIIPNMNASFNIQVKNGVIRRSTLLSTFLTKINIFKKISPDASEKILKNMPFSLINGDFTMKDSIMKTDNLILTSPALNLTAIGEVNLKKSELNLIVGTQVLKTIGKILGNIPLAGDLFTVDNKALTLGYFRIKGPFEKPTISSLPFKSLGLGIKSFFKTILDIPMIFIPDNPDNETKKDQTPVIQ
jgi:hypothetical protein